MLDQLEEYITAHNIACELKGDHWHIFCKFEIKNSVTFHMPNCEEQEKRMFIIIKGSKKDNIYIHFYYLEIDYILNLDLKYKNCIDEYNTSEFKGLMDLTLCFDDFNVFRDFFEFFL